MKRMIKITVVFIGVFFLLLNVTDAQTARQIKNAQKEAVIKNEINLKHYTFVAQYALPLRGGQKYLTSDYDLRITPDSLIAWLPYFGRVFMDPPMNHDDAGIMFTSTKFDYKTEAKAKGGWTITIVPKDNRFTSKMTLDVYPNGTAYLLVNSNTRDQISFNGYIKEDIKNKPN